ncbi:MAG TPA: hypothetical protein VGI58_03175 [Streptosporangiaceae bacterium]|jgi:hypothetical protein
MPYQMPLRSGDPRRIGRYRVTGRLEGIPTEDPMFTGAAGDGAEVAISLLRGDWALDGAARDRFAAEAAVAKRVPPFCAARVLDAGLDGTDAYLVSEYVPGTSLLDLVSADGIQRGQDVEALAIGMATGLASVHQVGLVHGNFGPDYVIIGGDRRVRVIEYGITPPYGTATPSADMFAWAQTVVFAALARPPASMSDLDVLADHVRVPVERCLDPDPAERPAARAVVVSLLGTAELPAGVLAEGARRAIRPVTADGYGQSGRGASDGPGDSWRTGDSRGPDIGPAGARLAVAGSPRPGPAPGRGSRNEPSAASRRAGTGIPAQRAGQRSSIPPQRGPGQHGSGRANSRSGQPAPAGHQRAAAQTGSRSAVTRRRIAWAGALVVVLAVVIGVLLYIAEGSGGKPANGPGNPAASHRPSASPRQSPATPLVAGPATPTPFVGSWTGQVMQTASGVRTTLSLHVVLASGKTTSRVTYNGPGIPALSCNLVNAKATSTQLTMNQIASGDSCAGGQVTMRLTGTGLASFAFSGNGETASGSVTRG